MKKHITILLEGNVQGVSFRFNARNIALENNIAGYIINQPDESVFIVAEGEEENLDKFVKWCQKGPDQAVVTNATIHEGELQNLEGFNIEMS